MKTRSGSIMAFAVLFLAVQAAQADLIYNFIGTGLHSGSPAGSRDYVQVTFGILDASVNTEDDLLDLPEGTSLLSFYDAVYTTTTGDPAFNVTDHFSGNCTITTRDIIIVDDLVVQGTINLSFPQNPLSELPTYFFMEVKGPSSRPCTFDYTWSPSPYNYEANSCTVTSSVPEPSALSFLAMGFMGLLGFAFRKKNKEPPAKHRLLEWEPFKQNGL